MGVFPVRRLGAFALAAGLACGGSAPAPAPAPRAETAALPDFSPTDTSVFLRVRFAQGTTSGILDDSLPAGHDRGYLLGALQDQVMLAHAIAWSPAVGQEGPEARVRVYRAHDGAELEAPGPDGPLWFGHLPGTGDYVIRVTAPAERRVSYTLAVQIPRRLILDRRDLDPLTPAELRSTHIGQQGDEITPGSTRVLRRQSPDDMGRRDRRLREQRRR